MRLFTPVVGIKMDLLTSNTETTNKSLGTSLVTQKHCLKYLSKDFCKLAPLESSKQSVQNTVHRVNYCIQYIYNKTCWLTKKLQYYIKLESTIQPQAGIWTIMHIKSTKFNIKHLKCVYFVKIMAISDFKVPSMCLHRLWILK